MTRREVPRGFWLACAVLLTNFYSGTVSGQALYEVKKGEGLLAIATKLQYGGATRFQVVAALYRANQELFPDSNINTLKEGQALKLPSPDQVASISVAEAAQMWRALTANPPPPSIAAASPSPSERAIPAKPAASRLARADQVRRYREGLSLEQQGDDKAALRAFLDAGESGYGPAQRKLGEIYDKGNSVVARDYESALRWYQRAREQGIEIPRPFVRSPR